VIKAFEGEDRQVQQLQKVSTETLTAWLQARRVSALMSPVVTLAVAVCTGIVLWRGALLLLSGAMTIGSLPAFLAYLARFFLPAGARPRSDGQHDRDGDGRLPAGDVGLRCRHGDP